ncbi:hypothetical protein ABFX02_14G002900, partial [Erythranthe guttata]
KSKQISDDSPGNNRTALLTTVNGDFPPKAASQLSASTATSAIPFSANLGFPLSDCSASGTSPSSTALYASRHCCSAFFGLLPLLTRSLFTVERASLDFSFTAATIMSPSPATSA